MYPRHFLAPQAVARGPSPEPHHTGEVYHERFECIAKGFRCTDNGGYFVGVAAVRAAPRKTAEPADGDRVCSHNCAA